MPRYQRTFIREFIYRQFIAQLVLGRVRAVDIARECEIPESSVRFWKYAFIRKWGSEENARIRAEAMLMREQSQA